jgi:hypothetical protein
VLRSLAMPHAPSLSVVLSGALLAVGARSAAADPRADFAAHLHEYTGDYYRPFVIEKLTTFKLGKACWKKMLDKNENGEHSASFFTADVAELAKRLAGDDWSEIESANNSDREANKPKVEKLVDAFHARFSFTLTADGDDCDTTTGSLMLRYWTTVGELLKDWTPKSGKAFITLNVSAKAKDVSVTASKDGTKFTITAPRDKEVAEWDTKITRPFAKAGKK